MSQFFPIKLNQIWESTAKTVGTKALKHSRKEQGTQI